ncbi:MAG: hypothetical protein H7Y02_05345 [Candidatus Obscuribacterales bacterium]|nr:hypothetical protein [Steroidobacteraceae bacterium]
MNLTLLERLANKYVWWSAPDQALTRPDRVVAHVMNIGDFDDVQELIVAVGDDYLRRVLVNAEIGQFNDRSWHYWHYRLALCDVGQVPPLPSRRVA